MFSWPFGSRGDWKSGRRKNRLRSIRLDAEELEDRRLLATSASGTVQPFVHGQFSPRVTQAFEDVADLSQYTAAQLASDQWAVAVTPGTSRNAVAAALGVPPDRLVTTNYLRDTYVFDVGGPNQPSVSQVIDRLNAFDRDRYYFPLVEVELKTHAVPNDPYFADQWSLLNFGQVPGGIPGEDANVVNVWNRYDGTGVVIAILDDGLQMNHPDLVGNIRPDLSYDYLLGDNDPSPGGIDDNHGTAVAGVAAAVGNNSIGVAGAAYGADLAGVRMLGDQSNDFKISLALAHRSDLIDVYNNSWGQALPTYSGTGPFSIAAIEDNAVNGRNGKGNIYVFSAGNDRQLLANTNYSPYTNSIFTTTIGAVDHRGQIASYSTPGASVFAVSQSQGDFGTPAIMTTDRTGADGYNQPGANEFPEPDPFPNIDYTSIFNGTSASAPLASGIIALMVDANPNLTYRDIQHILAATSRQVAPNDPDWTTNGKGYLVHHDFGFGAIDATAAVRMAEVWTNVANQQNLSLPNPVTVNEDVGTPERDGFTFTLQVDTAVEDRLFALEWIEMEFGATHRRPSDLSIRLTSPSGTTARLAATHGGLVFAEDNADFRWTYSSNHFWGENIPGDWTISVFDNNPTPIDIVDPANPDDDIPSSGTWDDFRLIFHGTESAVVIPPVPPAPVSSIIGTVYNDVNQDGQQDSTETGLAGRLVYIDANNNSVQDPGEAQTMTGQSGLYVFAGLPAGTYTIRLACYDRFTQTAPANAGAHFVTVGTDSTALNVDFGTFESGIPCSAGVPVGEITGIVFIDSNSNGEHDTDESGAAGIRVYADVNNDCWVGITEPSALTDGSGRFRLAGLPSGTYSVRTALTAGYLGTGGCNSVVASVGPTGLSSISPAFGVTMNFNNAGSNIPTHGIVNGFHLGPTVSSDPQVNDDDGVYFITGIHTGQIERVGIIAHQLAVSPGYLQAWIDFNGDGDWDDLGEQIFHNERLEDGVNIRSFVVPPCIQATMAAARFRWGFERDISPHATALAGETEDYVVVIPSEGNTGTTAHPDVFTVQEDSSDNLLDVLANDTSGIFGGSITISAVGTPDQGGTVAISNGKLSYTPAPNFAGDEKFTYTVTDSFGGTSTTNVTVTVEDVNDPVVANDDTFVIVTGSIGNILDVLANDSSGPDIDDEVTIASFTSPSQGGVLTLGTGGLSLLYTPATGFSGTETFSYTITDGRGSTDDANVTITVSEADPIMRIRLVATDTNGSPVTTALVGQQFQLRGFVQDLRPVAGNDPRGVFSAYLDVTFNANLATAQPAIVFGPDYGDGQSGSVMIPGLIDEIGATDGIVPLGPSERLLFVVTLNATGEGSVNFLPNPADIMPLHQSSVFGLSGAVSPALIDYVSTSIFVGVPGVRDDAFTVIEDSINNPLDVLANDLPDTGLGPFTITSVSAATAGGTVTIASGGGSLLYTPAPNFFGVETFTYTVRDTANNPQTATVTMTVLNVNDSPTARDDMFFNIERNSANVALNVLANDTQLPDENEELLIIEVTNPSSGGTVVIAADSKSLVYTPAIGFVGIDTFTYTITDQNGETDQATVRIQVQDAVDFDQVGFIFEVVDLSGRPIESILVGQQFRLNVYVQDLRSIPDGVFSAFLDVTFESNVAVVGDVSGFLFNSRYPTGRNGIPGNGTIDELGAIDGISSTEVEALELLVTIPFVANSIGDVTFTGNPADIIPAHETSLFGETGRVVEGDQAFGLDNLSVVVPVSPSSAGGDTRDVNGDGVVSPLDALLVINDLTANGPRMLQGTSTTVSHLDVNGDGAISPHDPLLIINTLTPAGTVRAPNGMIVYFDETEEEGGESLESQPLIRGEILSDLDDVVQVLAVDLQSRANARFQ